MKRIFLLIIVFIWLLCSAYTCTRESDTCHKTINFVNKSTKEVYIQSYYTPFDTLIFSSVFSNPYNEPDLYRVKPEERNSDGLFRRGCIDDRVKQGIAVIFVFDSEILANYSWGEIGKNYMVLKTIRPTLEDMERDNWTIYFMGE